jgi:prevent-host-death family protein
MKSIAVTVFKAKCLSLLDDVARTGEDIIVTKRGRPLARIVATSTTRGKYPQDELRGSVKILGDVITPVLPPEAWNAVRGVLLPAGRPKRSRRRARR